MGKSQWNAVTNIGLGIAGTMAALYLVDLMEGPNQSDVGVPMYANGSGALSSGFFLLLGLLFLAAYISHRLFPAKFWPSIVIGASMVLVYGILGSWITA